MARTAHDIEGELDAARADWSNGLPGSLARCGELEAELAAALASAPVKAPAKKRKAPAKASAKRPSAKK